MKSRKCNAGWFRREKRVERERERERESERERARESEKFIERNTSTTRARICGG